MGFKGVYMPGAGCTAEDFDDEIYDPLWATCVELDMPICFHTFGSRRRGAESAWTRIRGKNQINGWHATIRDNQDIIGMLIFGAVFDRFPDLKLICVEADAGWVPHYMYRMDHMYARHRYWQKAPPLKRLPSDYFRDNVWLTFQDDLVAFQTAELMNPKRLMWANDFPHADSTWPWSHSLLAEQTKGVSEENKHLILHQNVKELFDLQVN
jgi:predicted TIM-barrel fold metal-dependent hydrolase